MTPKPYVHQPYPSDRYHPDGRVQTVRDRAHEMEICPPEDGWRDTPAAFEPPAEMNDEQVPAAAPRKTRR